MQDQFGLRHLGIYARVWKFPSLLLENQIGRSGAVPWLAAAPANSSAKPIIWSVSRAPCAGYQMAERTEGWLFKKSAGKGWQKRYFVLQPDRASLVYFSAFLASCRRQVIDESPPTPVCSHRRRRQDAGKEKSRIHSAGQL